ncbi:hypothetical protein NQ317_003566 [Molorchus minor]|uniref:Cleft lip and palate associated transmembrane protein n=1 Tax=Molorchus minor TaxID=1323400 RepID=A0ABQ9JEP6_9CUCU|nr:hypothetical protein NQ317_003566 [Molorchus minor]
MSETQKENNASTNGSTVVAQNSPEGTFTSENGNVQPAVAQRQPTKLESFFAVLKSLIVRGLIIYFITSFFRSPQTPKVSENGIKAPQTAARNVFPDGTALELKNETLENFRTAELFWYNGEITYGDWTAGPNQDGSYVIEKPVPITPNMRNNGSLYLHVFVTKAGLNPDPNDKYFAHNQMAYTVKQLNRYKRLKSSGTKNLLTGESEKFEVDDGKIVSHWHPNLTLNLVMDQTAWTYGAVPAPLDQYIKFTDDGKFYKPVLFANDFWNMARDYKPLNDSLTLQLTFQPLSLFKWQLYAAQHMRQMWNVWGDSEPTQTDEEQDTLKETLLDTNPYLLGLTIIVSIIHSVFELLAFKNDIQFWNNRNSLEGLSVRSVFFGVFQSLIVLLYVFDNETNTVIKISCFVGLGIEFWKIWKVIDIKFENGKLVFKDKSSYVESSTKVYDKLAFKYLSWVCFPLLAGYSAYALLYLEHKGWYSFILNLFYGYLLTFGFIMMTPQLFINYKLKSVAHLPWRMLTYKFFNTFIDDMFAFVIKMPTMYRIGCFRDDIVFLVYLYQRWMYPVDKTRQNEFGFSGEQAENRDQRSITAGDQSVVESKEG